ncbi:nucleotide sugar dehydrogenase [Kovacikia minuta CCNUW1]|uniref:UDP-glucose dehydrogenase family protein n=1 Tax=Kovacikia minuta TaxID=2931930 RepID=UPI001CCF4C8C|nr:nucleotide sugar dehydrogenase [Kovacikia minuta]UBF28443.1 nucleotide sugar dehydrogenase [Kovacikia minuta CCNUW1]
MTEIQTVSVVGLGKLGAPMVACLADKGYRVIGVDVNPAAIEAINAGKAPVQEPGLGEMLARNHDRIRATTDYGDAIADSDVTFIIVPTPSDASGKFSIKYILSAIDHIGQALRSKEQFHLIVITSTVMPGATGGEIREALEAKSGKRCGEGFGLCYSPEFIALGSVIHDMLNPDFILVGESDPKSGEILATIYRNLVNNDPPVSHMNLVNAELAKISVNTFVTTKISYANMLGEICERLPGADVDVVTAAIGQDSRIGKKYLRGATGYGGPCFPRDNVAFGVLAQSVGANAAIAEATDVINRKQAARIVSHLLPRLKPDSKVGILGLAYKPDTNVIEESQGVALAQELLSKGFSVILYDPLALDNTRQILGSAPEYAASIQACVHQSDAIVITTPCQAFKTLEPTDFSPATPSQPKVVLDCWRVLNRDRFATICEYIALGVG